MTFDGIEPAPKCAATTGLFDCPATHPYSYFQGEYCCQSNLVLDYMNAANPLINFGSNNCEGDAYITCDSPPCLNNGCRLYNCYIKNKDLSGGKNTCS